MDSLFVASSWHELLVLADCAAATPRRRSFESDRIKLLEKTGCLHPLDYERKVSTFVQTPAGVSAVINVETSKGYSLGGCIQTRTWQIGSSMADPSWKVWIQPQPLDTSAQIFQEMLNSPPSFPRWTYEKEEIDSATYESVKLLQVAAFCAFELLRETPRLYIEVRSYEYDAEDEETVELKLEDGADRQPLVVEILYRDDSVVGDMSFRIEIATSLAPVLAWAIFKLIRDNATYFKEPKRRYLSSQGKAAEKLDEWIVRAARIVLPSSAQALASQLSPHSDLLFVGDIARYLLEFA